MRYFAITDLSVIEDMTLCEYNLQMEAAQLKQLDRKREIHEMAWASQAVQQTTGSSGRLKFDSFDKFFGDSYKEAVADVQHRYNPKVVVEGRKKIDESQYNLELLKKIERGLNNG